MLSAVSLSFPSFSNNKVSEKAAIFGVSSCSPSAVFFSCR